MHAAFLWAFLAWVRMLAVSLLIAVAIERVWSRFRLICSTELLMLRAVPRIVDTVPLMLRAVPLIVVADPLIEIARPSIDLARRMISASSPSSGLAVFRIELASSLVLFSWSTASVAVLMPRPVLAMFSAFALIDSAVVAVRWSSTAA